ncbi:MAG: ABC transporter permease [bacterium]|nr:ABC transporter permease [bacterium]
MTRVRIRRLPMRLIVGLSILCTTILSCLLGPSFLSASEASDPVHAALLAPCTQVTVIERSNGSSIVSPSPQFKSDRILIKGPRRTMEVSLSSVVSTHTHRVWLGTDRFGRDVLSQLLTGGRVSLLIAGLALVIAVIIGGLIGMVSATAGGWVDATLMRLVDALIAFPVLFLMILAVSVLRPSALVLILLLGLTSWMNFSRLVRGQVLSLRSRQFVLAARSSGTPWFVIWIRHLAPNAAGPLAQDLALRIGALILAEATLSYLGLGVPPSTPTWGSLIHQGHQVLPSGWWLATFPGLAIAATIVSLALVGDGIQQLATDVVPATEPW